MINLNNKIVDIALGTVPIAKVCIGTELVWEKAGPEYIQFEDPVVNDICSKSWGDYTETVITDNGDNTVNIVVTFKSKLNTTVKKSRIISSQMNVDNSGGEYTPGTTTTGVGITIAQAAAVTTIGTKFTKNTSITSFMELPLFTGSVTYDNNHYYYNAQNNNGAIFYNCTKLRKVKIPEGVTNMQSTFRNCSALAFIDLPSTVIKTAGYIWSNTPAKCLICRAVTPPKFTQSDAYGKLNPTLGLYVPDESVDTYKATSRWSAFASYIKPLSQFDTDYPNGFN